MLGQSGKAQVWRVTGDHPNGADLTEVVGDEIALPDHASGALDGLLIAPPQFDEAFRYAFGRLLHRDRMKFPAQHPRKGVEIAREWPEALDGRDQEGAVARAGVEKAS